MKYTAEQYEAMAKHLRESTPNWRRESFGDWKNYALTSDRSPKDAADMLDEAAALLREQAKGAQEKPIGIVHDFGAIDWLGGKCPKGGTEIYTAPRASVPDGWRDRLVETLNLYYRLGMARASNKSAEEADRLIGLLSAAPSDGGEKGEQHE